MGAEKKRLRDEVAELSEAVRALRDELAAIRATRCCHGCRCVQTVWYYPTWNGTVTSGGYTVTNTLSQGNLDKPHGCDTVAVRAGRR